MVNERILGTVTLTKFTKLDNTTYTLNGAEFTLYREQTRSEVTSFSQWISWITGLLTGNNYKTVGSAGEVSIEATPQDGNLVISDLPWGRYKLVETKAPDGYKLENVSIEFVIDENQQEVTINADSAVNAENHPFTFTFSKHAKAGLVGQTGLQGAEFELYEVNGDTETKIQTNQSLTSGADGNVTLCSVESDGDGKLKTILKTSTRDDPVIYRLKETKAPDGYILPSPAPYVDVWFDSAGNAQFAAGRNVTQDFQFLDDPIQITLLKYDGGDAFADQRLMDGVEFTLKDEAGNTKTYTAQNGTITFGPGDVVGGKTYTLIETTMNGYEPLTFAIRVNTDGTVALLEAQPENVSVSEDGKQITVVNERILGTVTLTKYTQLAQEHHLNGAVFSLLREDQPVTWWEKLKDFVTGTKYELVWSTDNKTLAQTIETTTAEGDLVISNLPWGTYTLKETKAPDGYKLDDQKFTFTIGPDSQDAKVLLNQSGKVLNEQNRVQVQKVAEEDGRILQGAVFQLYQNVTDENGQVTLVEITNTNNELQPMWVWNASTGTGVASCLLVGEYTLVEQTPPAGYRKADDVVFHIDEYGEVTAEVKADKMTIVVEDTLTSFSFNKTGLVNESCADKSLSIFVPAPNETRPLADVVFTAYKDAALTQAVMTAESGEDGVVTFTGLPLGNYYIKETQTLDGYVLDDTVYTVTITSEDNIVLMRDGQPVADNTVVNDVYRGDLEFTKVSELDSTKTIPGGVYGLYRDNLMIAKAVSGSNGKVSFRGLLMDVEYTVRELEVPAGSYRSANVVKFRFTEENGVVQMVILDDGEDTVKQTEGGLLWLEPQTVVSILKTNEKGEPLSGAKLEIKDAWGNVVTLYNENGEPFTSWISTGKPLEITGQLEAGKTYRLVELSAPAGYDVARSVWFTIDDEPVAPDKGTVIKITMVDKLSTGIPKTGDSEDPVMYAVTAGASATALAVLLLLKKKRSKKA